MSFLQKIFGTNSDKEIRKIKPLLQQTNALAERYAQLSEADLKAMTPKFKQRLATGESLDDILPEAFATVKEASHRVLAMTPYDVQVLGGIILHQGRIAEMKTGEGKTLVAAMPVYLNALSEKGVHVVTVNDYLAERDSEWMGKIYRYLGLSVGLIIHGINKNQRREAYASDITYGTNNEFGFDYLRDNMVTSLEELVQRELNFAIVDEVDSILIDEARTPLIISGPGEASSDNYRKAQSFVAGLQSMNYVPSTDKLDFEKEDELEQLQDQADFLIDEKAGSAVLTKRGIHKAERFFHLDNLADPENFDLNHYINNALKANGIFHRDQDYVVQEGEIIIVDDFTGRLMYGRRYSNGLHQAIEAKEGVEVKRESKTLATITFQNYFRMYNKLSGMTGTALTEEEEFKSIYHLDVVEIPTNQPIARQDEEDAIYKNKAGKIQRLIEEAKAVHDKGQPILVGTVSVESSEQISRAFTKAGLPHHVLNAKYHAQEAEIIAQAGRLGAITIATNMAGRGTDIMLGGNPEFLAKQAMRKEGFSEELIEAADAYNETTDSHILAARETFQSLEKDFKQEIDQEKSRVIAAGGLYIMGTERHESRRIDNQLRGRSGRQGDPGKSKFFLSLDDDLLRLFGGERLTSVFESLGVDADMEINHRMLTKAIESAQRKVEGQNFSIRKNVLEYDNVMNKQRELIYRQRRDVLEGKDVHSFYQRNLDKFISDTVHRYAGSVQNGEWDQKGLAASLREVLGNLDLLRQIEEQSVMIAPEELIERLTTAAHAVLEAKAEMFGSPERFHEAERFILLSVVDKHWMEHIDNMDTLRDSIGMRAYGQQDPVVAYQKEGFDMFDEMNLGIQEEAVKILMRGQIFDPSTQQAKEPDEASLNAGRKQASSALDEAQASLSSHRQAAEQAGGSQQPVVKKVLPGRNDPCWCGSGKKYKNCHMRSDEAEARNH